MYVVFVIIRQDCYFRIQNRYLCHRGVLLQIMYAKVAQNHDTKEQKTKNPSRVLLSNIFNVPLSPTMSH